MNTKRNIISQIWLRVCAALFAVILTCTAAHAAAPANNSFGTSTLISGASGTRAGTNVEATKQAGEPDHAGDPGGQSVWYRWVAPSSGLFTFDTQGSDFDVLLAVYTGTTLANLVEVKSSFGEVFYDYPARVYFTATGGTTYRIAVDGWAADTAEQGSIQLNWAAVPAPANDNFASAKVITGPGGTTDATNLAATKEVGEPDHAGDPGGASVWFRWTAPGDGAATFSTSGAFATNLAVYTGGGLVSLVEETSGPDTVSFTATAGTVYQIAMDGVGGSSGAIGLDWSLLGLQDNFANAVVLTGVEGTRADSNVGAGAETDEPEHGGEGAGLRKTIWYRWMAPASGLVRFGAQNRYGTGEYDVTALIVAVYTGTSLNGLTLVGQSGESNNYNDAVIFSAVAGTEYRIAVDSQSFSNGGTFTLDWLQAGPPANDNLANAQVLSGTSGQVSAVMLGSTLETGEFGGPEYGSVFYRFTAPSAGVFTMGLTAGQFGGGFIEIRQVAATGADPFETLEYSGLVGVAAGDVVTMSVAANPFSYPKFNLTYQFTAGASLFDFYMNDYLLLERTAQATTITVYRSGAVSQAASVTLVPSTGAGYAVKGTHFTLSQTVLNFAAGETEKTVTMTMVNNTVTEGALNVRLNLQAGTNAVIRPRYISGTRFDDEDDPANNLIGNATVLVGASGTQNGTTEGADPDQATDPGYADLPNGDAGVLEYVDETVWYRWTAVATGPIAFTANFVSNSGLYQEEGILAVFDGAGPNATQIAVGHGYEYGSPFIASAGWVATSGTTYYIVLAANEYDNVNVARIGGLPYSLNWAVPAAGFVSISDVSGIEGPSAVVPITITRTNGTAAFDIRLRTIENSNATEGVDYTAVDQLVSFGVGEMSKTVNVALLDDALTEPEERFGVYLELDAPNPDVFIAQSSANAKIIDDESGAIVTLDPFGDDLETALEDSGSFGVRVLRQGITSSVATVNYAVTAGSATSADATLGSGTVTFAAGETEKYITIPITDDTLDEPAESLTLTLSSPGTATTLGVKTTATLTIVDDDIPGVLAFSAATASVVENVGTANITVQRTAGSDGAVSVNYTVSAGTAIVGEHFVAGSGTLNFAHTETSKAIPVAVLDNEFDDASRTFTVTLSGPTAGASLGAMTSTTVTITDNDTFVAEKTLFSAMLKLNGEPKGLLTVKSGVSGAVTAQATIGTVKYSFVGLLAADGRASLIAKKKGESDKTLAFQIGGPRVLGTLNDGMGSVYTFDGAENDLGTKTAPVGVAGNYTAIIQTRTAPNGGLLAAGFPQGDGWVSIKVGPDGKSKMKGKLADGTALSFAGPLDVNDHLQVFAPLYVKKQGSIALTVVFDSAQTTTDATASAVRWVKPANAKDKVYPLGWVAGITADLFGSKFVAPAKVSAKNPAPPYILGTHNLLGLTAPSPISIALSEGSISPSFFPSDASVDAKSKVVVVAYTLIPRYAPNLVMKIKPTGEISGSFTHPLNGKAAKFSGVILQKNHTAGGYFLAPDGKSGAMGIVPK